MKDVVDWIAAEAEHKVPRLRTISQKARDHAALGMTELWGVRNDREAIADLPAHSFPRKGQFTTEETLRLGSGQAGEHRGSQNPHPVCAKTAQTRVGHPPVGYPREPELKEADSSFPELSWEEERERRIYRGRTVTMLRRYMRYSMETGRLPSLLGREFFRAQVTRYTVVTFEDRVIFVHDMETCLNRLDEFSRQLIARHILQEHDQEATAKLLHCTGRTVRTYVPIALDLLSEILLDVGLLERTFPIREKSCQGGKTSEIPVSGSEESKNKN